MMPHATASGTRETATTTTPGARTLALILMFPGAPVRGEDAADRGLSTAQPRAVAPTDDTPRATALTARQSCVIIAEQDAILLVLALGVSLHRGEKGGITMSGSELRRLRTLGTVLHRQLRAPARSAVRARASDLTRSPAAQPVDDYQSAHRGPQRPGASVSGRTRQALASRLQHDRD